MALATTLFHVKGYTSPETIMAFERANAMIEQAEALGERPQGEDALLRFLSAVWPVDRQLFRGKSRKGD